jgi:hypothetical protein
VAVSTADFPPQTFGRDFYLLINDFYVMSARPLDGFPQGYIGFAERQRMWARIAVTDSVKAQIYNPFTQERKAYLGSTDVEVGFAGKSRTEEPYDQGELAKSVIEVGQALQSFRYLCAFLNWAVEIQRPDFGTRPKGVDGLSGNSAFFDYKDRRVGRPDV